MQAGLLLSAMEFVFSRSLGVDCTHCHVPGKWSDDTKPAKGVAREMYKLMIDIDEQLAKIDNLPSATPIVSCYTCHRGQTRPEIELPEVKPPK